LVGGWQVKQRSGTLMHRTNNNLIQSYPNVVQPRRDSGQSCWAWETSTTTSPYRSSRYARAFIVVEDQGGCSV
jgi:hypothetical protein